MPSTRVNVSLTFGPTTTLRYTANTRREADVNHVHTLKTIAKSIGWFFFLGAVILPTTAAIADSKKEAWFTDLELVTEIPLSFGVRMLVESPSRVRLGFAVGALPEGYIRLVNTAVVAVGGYDQNTANLIEASVDRSLVVRADLGWRPLEEYGFYAQTGYRLMTFGGIVPGEAVFSLLTDAPAVDQVNFYSYDIDSTLHAIDTEVGWQWFLPWWQLQARLGLGFVATVASNIEVVPLRNIDLYKAEIEQTLNDVYTSYGFTPTLNAAVGVRFD